MEAVGRLAGGVAHDFRNQLTVIKWSAERLLREDLVAGEGREDAEEIVKAADASRAVTEQLLALGRREQLHPQLVDLGEVMGDLARALPAMVGPKVRVAVAAGDGGRPCPARVDPARLRQALANLVSNARDAMPDGGELTVRTACADVDESDARAHGVGPGRYAVLAVCDTGSGMDEATRSRIFEPFYTTKDAANGTGLGLPMVYAFVAQSGGFIEVDSAPGEGSTFRLHLPAARRAAPEAETPRGRPPADASDDRATRPDGKTGSMGTRR